MSPSTPSVGYDQGDAVGSKISELLHSAEIALNESFPPNVDAAFAAFQQALAIDPNHVGVLDAMGELLADLGDTDRALQVLLRSVELAPNSGPSKYFYLGQMLRGTDALEAYRKCASLMDQASDKDRMVSVLCAMGELFMTDLCDEADAETNCQEAFQRAVALNPDSVEALTGIATFHRIRLEIEQARNYCTKAFEKISTVLESPEFVDMDDVAAFGIRLRLASNMVELEMIDEGLTVLSTLLEEDEEDIQSWFLTGCCHLVGKQREEALECAKQCRKLLKKNRNDMDPALVQHWTKTLDDLDARVSSI